MKWAYYNDNDAFCCQWLRNLMAAGHIPEGEVDERPIQEVQADDLKGFRQIHLFAGLGGWAYALRLAGWPDDVPVWTGSCPCPPFSQAGKTKSCPACEGRNLVPHPYRTGHFVCCGCQHEWLADGRHLWPEFRRLIEGCRPEYVFGEQVAGADGLVWLAGVHATLEELGYGVWRADLPVAGLGAPDIRQRLWWVADAEGARRRSDARTIREREASRIREAQGEDVWGAEQQTGRLVNRGSACGLAEPTGSGQPRRTETPGKDGQETRDDSGMGNANTSGCAQDKTIPRSPAASTSLSVPLGGVGDPAGTRLQAERATPTLTRQDDHSTSPWRDFEHIDCADGKTRRIESGTFPLAFGLPRSMGQVKPGLEEMGALAEAIEALAGAKRNRIGRLKGYGNSIAPALAAEFIKAWQDVKAESRQ